MSYPTVNQAIAKLIMEAKFKVVDDLEAALESENEEFRLATLPFIKKFKDVLMEIETAAVKDAGKKNKKAAKATSGSDSDDSKKKRQASCFNLFVKDIMPTIAAENPEMNGKETMAAASAAWKTNPMGAFIKEKFEELKKEAGAEEISNIDLFAKAKAAYIAENGDVSATVESEPEASDSEIKPKTKKTATKKTTKET
jgi:hypothetical protein